MAGQGFPQVRRSGTDIQHNVTRFWFQQAPEKVELSSSGLQIESVLKLTYEAQMYSSLSEVQTSQTAFTDPLTIFLFLRET